MTQKLLTTFLVFGLIASTGLYAAPAPQDNTIVSGPGYEKGQQSQKVLTFAMPQGWAKDEKAAKQFGVHTVLVPSGEKLDSADKVITIAFQKKDAAKQGLEDLKSFFRDDLKNTLAQFPDAQFARWQPSKLDPDKIAYVSLEMYGKQKDKPSPQHFLILDSGDGYFSVSLTVGTRKDLQLPIYDEFFNSLELKGAR